MDSVWLFSNHVVFKSGKSLKYLPRTAKTSKKPKDFNIDLGHDVWIQDIYATGIDDLI